MNARVLLLPLLPVAVLAASAAVLHWALGRYWLRADRHAAVRHVEQYLGYAPYLAGVGGRMGDSLERPVDAPYHTTTAKADTVVVTPFLARTGSPESRTKEHSVEGPMHTVMPSPNEALVETTLAPFGVHVAHGEESPSGVKRWGKGDRDLEEPMPTLTASQDIAVVTPFLARTAYKGANGSYVEDVREPARTITAQNDGYSVVQPVLAHVDDESQHAIVGCNCGISYEQWIDGTPCPKDCGGGGKSTTYLYPDLRERDRSIVAMLASENDMYRCVECGEYFVVNDYPDGSPCCGYGTEIEDVIKVSERGIYSAAFLTRFNQNGVGSDLSEPIDTVMAGAPRFGLTEVEVAPVIVRQNFDGAGKPADSTEPMPTVSAQGQHIGAVYAFLTAYFGNEQAGQAVETPLRTATAKERFALVYVAGEPYAIVDIGMRMLTPRELFRAQGFPEDYVIEEVEGGRKLTKTAQIRMCGNSVCPPVAEALVRANVGSVAEEIAA